MINKNIFDKEGLDKLETKSTREGFGDALLDLGSYFNDIVALSADLTESVQMHKFRDAFPERFVEIGIAEQNMASVASGMAAMGKVPFIASYAAFNPGRNWEQIRTTICYNDRKVIIIGAHSGLSVGPDGGTHQALEDIALMRVLPNMTVLSPSDYREAYNMTKIAYQIPGPVYIRLTREKTPMLFEKDFENKVGVADVVHVSDFTSLNKLGIISTGPILCEVLKAVKILETDYKIQINVLNVTTIKPIDENQIIRFAQNNKKIITVEEHQVSGGLGSLVSEILSQNLPTKMKILGVKDRYGQSGTMQELCKEYGIDSDSIVKESLEFINNNQ
jgi:transketolase